MIYIIVLNWNNLPDTLECLDSVYNLGSPFKLIIVDNASSDNSLEGIISYLEKRGEPYCSNQSPEFNESMGAFRTAVIKNPDNLGFAGGNNAGIRYALTNKDCGYVWILNNDTVFPPATLSIMKNKYEELSKTRRVGFMGNKLLSYYDRTRIQTIGLHYNFYLGTGRNIGSGEPDSGQYDKDAIEGMVCASGASLFAGRAFMEDCGLMYEGYFLYNEEIDWALRGLKKGWETAYCWEAPVYHKEGGTSGGTDRQIDQKSRKSDYYMVRSRILFMKRFFPKRLFFVYLGLCFTILNRLKRRQFNRIPMILGLMAKGVSGGL